MTCERSIDDAKCLCCAPKGTLPQLIDVIIEEKTSLFVCAVGVPPKDVVEKLHAAKIPVMNMVGHPKHVEKALAVGVDLVSFLSSAYSTASIRT
jgi:NAD(P)H-dependent flavin oxidoreductase YrpB (nitropropane dioxygenase family)